MTGETHAPPTRLASHALGAQKRSIVTTRKPNVIFIIADQHRWDFVSWQNNGVTHTPNLQRLAAAGVTFRSAYCNSPLCCPSRQSIASGRYGVNSGCFTNLHELPPGTPSFVQQFRDAGYHTCAVGKTHMEIHAYDSDLTADYHLRFMDSLGWDETHETSGSSMLMSGITCAYSRFLQQEGKLDDVVRFYDFWWRSPEKTSRPDPYFLTQTWSLPEHLQETPFTARTAIDWLNARDRSRPFFLHVGFAAPHSPVEPLQRFLDLYSADDESPPFGAQKPSNTLPHDRTGYRATISGIDHYVGRILDTLDQQNILDNTIVLYLADHGEMAGDHDRFGKTCFFEGSIRVPLIIAGPGVQKGRTTDALVELIDLGSTLCDLCDVPAHSLDQGRSLRPVLTEPRDTHRETVYAEMGCDRMLFDGRYKLMWGDPWSDTRKLGTLHLDKPVNIPPSPCRLYDMHSDPNELNNLAQDPSHAERLAAMEEKLLVRQNQNNQPRPNKPRGKLNLRETRST